MNILSLFDGISCGKVALERAWIKVDKYYASEIDQYAIQISSKNHPNIIQLWDVNNWRNWDIDFWKIDLLLAGFPCQSRSIAWKQWWIEDPRWLLMYQMLHILEHIRKQNSNIKFLFENVVMKKEFLVFINKEIWVEPICINSSLLSAQNRKRMYRTNIDGVIQPEDKWITLNDILGFYTYNEVLRQEQYNKVKWLGAEYGFGGYILKDNAEKYGTLTASYWQITGNSAKIRCKEWYRILTPEEAEQLQTLDIWYTAGISTRQRYKTIGNARTVDIVAHILSFL